MNNEEKIIELLTEIRDSLKKPKLNGVNKSSQKFTPPTRAEVAAYCTVIKKNVDPQSFIDFYESKGWMVGKNKMKSWKAAIRTWAKRDNEIKKPISAQKDFPTGFDPSRNCGAGESLESCKIRAWREHERHNN
jgi:hypothetical protein